ncbi:GON-4-like protein [Haliotis asinina]|uniref:GON-4-like protein n=1 Tax=Haliotis asinina TaxID=109174 RepID=UPI003531D647
MMDNSPHDTLVPNNDVSVNQESVLTEDEGTDVKRNQKESSDSTEEVAVDSKGNVEVKDIMEGSPDIVVCSDRVGSPDTDSDDSQWMDVSDEVTEDEKESAVQVVSRTSFASTPVKDKTAQNSSTLSEEEKQNYAFISEQLSILNQESSEVNTAMHRSQKKQLKNTPSKNKGDQKKTPRKQLIMASLELESRKSLKKRLETTPPSTPSKSDVAGASGIAGVDYLSADDADTSQDRLQIADTDMDDKLEESARNKGLTAINVKNIIHELVKNEDVQQMIRNSLNEQLTSIGRLTHEPKMTRSKVKEVIEKGVPLEKWPLSPVKKTTAAKKPSILDLYFPDDEDDDEYSPDKDAEAQRESDDDMESMISSQASDLGSPMPPTPSTPKVRTPLQVNTPQTRDTETFQSPVVCTSGVGLHRTSAVGLHFKNSMAALEDTSTQESTHSDIIARRTRSKLPLTDTSLTAIEEAFVAPDITPDMYDTECDDSEWQEFLRSLVKPDSEPVDQPADDEANDPEFNFLEEAEKIVEVEEDFRFDRPFRVSKKELNQLIDELDELFPEQEEDDKSMELEETLPQKQTVKAKRSPVKAPITNIHRAELEENALITTAEEKLLIEEQMRKHVQLTTQLFFLCKGSEDFEPMTSLCRQMLRELDIFRCVSMARDLSSFNVCNLQLAIDAFGEDSSWNLSQEHEDASSYSVEDTNSNATDSDYDSVDGGKKISRKKGSSSTRHPLLPSQIEVFWSSPVFLYPQLLPCRRLLSQEEARDMRLTFTGGEDNLIALGLEQFHGLKNPRSLIQKYLLPAKTLKQINLRVKNMSSQRAPDNPIKYFQRNKKMLPKTLVVEAFSPDQMVALRDQDDSILPIWAKKKRAKEAAHALREKTKQKKSSARKRSSSLSIPMDVVDVSNQLEVDVTWTPSKKKPRSAPVSPADNEEGDSGTKRRCVEDTYSHQKMPVGKPIITPEGIFIPFKIAPQPGSVSTPSTPSSMFPSPQISLPCLSTDLKSLHGSIRVIPATKPGESPQIFSSMIAIPGKPIPLFCRPDLETMSVAGREGQDRVHIQEQHSESGQSSVSNKDAGLTESDEMVRMSEDASGQTEVLKSGCPSSTPADNVDKQECVLDDEGMSYECSDTDVGRVKTQSGRADHCQVETTSGFVERQTADDTTNRASETSQITLMDIDKDRSQTVMEAGDTESPPVTRPAVTESQVSDDPHLKCQTVMESEVAENSNVRCQKVLESDVVDNPQGAHRDLGLSSGHSDCEVTNNNQNFAVAQPTGTDVNKDEQSDTAAIHRSDVSDSCGVLADGSVVQASSCNETSNQVSQAVATIMKDSLRDSVVNVSVEADASAHMTEKQTETDVNTCTASAGIVDTPQTQSSEDCIREVKGGHVKEESAGHDKEVELGEIKDMGVADNKEVGVGDVQEVCVGDATAAQTSEVRTAVVTSAVSFHEVVPDKVFEITSGSDKTDQSVSNSEKAAAGDGDSKEHVITNSENLGTNSEQKQEAVVGMSGDASNHDNSLKGSGPAADELSSKQPPSPSPSTSTTPYVTPLEIIAALCPYYSPSSKTARQNLLERTPPKRQSETTFRELKPKSPCKLNKPETDLPKPVSPFLPKMVSKSPKNKRVVVGNRTILPKTFVLDTKESPTKRAARSLRKRAQMICQRTSPCKLLPQTDLQRIQRMQLCPLNKSLSNIGRSKRKQAAPVRKLLHNSLKRCNSESDDLSETEEGRKSEEGSRLRTGPKRKISEVDGKQEESDGGQSEMEDSVLSQEDSQNEDETEDGQTADKNHLDMLMAASTTLRFDHKKNRERSKSKTKKKEQTLAMLAPDLLEMDPRKDEKDTAFAQAYLDRVRDSLSGNLQVYEEFLTLMYNVGKDGLSAVEVYKSLSQLLKDFPELLDDFAGFLLPEQALMCGCFMKNQEVNKARTFLRKLEVNYEQQPHHFQRVLKTLSQWYQNPKRSSDDLRDLIKPLIRGMPHLQEEFSMFFPEDKPPDSYGDSFEVVTLGDSDLDDDASVDSFEDVIMPSELDPYRTKRCPCDCHKDPNDIKLHKRIRHCFNCCLKVIDGKLYFQPSSKKLHPAEVVVHEAVPPSPQTTTLELEDDQTADKENHNYLSSRPSIVSPSVSHTSPARAKKIKLKICRQKAGQKRFLSLNELGSSPVKLEQDTEGTSNVTGSADSDTGVMTRTRKSQEKCSGTQTSDYVVSVPDDLVVNPPVVMQDQIMQEDQQGDSSSLVTSNPVMVTSFSPVFTSSAAVTTVCPSVPTLVPQTVTTPITQEPGSDRLTGTTSSTTKPPGQTGGFVKLSPSKGPSSPNVTQISIGVTQTSGRSSGTVKSAKTLTIGSTISALSGSVKESKIPKEAPSLPNTEAGRDKGTVSFPNLMPVGVSHTDAITLNSGKQMPTPTASATNTASQVQACDGGSVSGTGFGMSILEMFDGPSMQGDASQSCMSDILAKAMKTAEISRSDADISMSMDFMNNCMAANSKTFGSRNNSPVKSVPVLSEATQRDVITLKEHLVKAGIIHKSDDLEAGTGSSQCNQPEPIGGQSGRQVNSVTTITGIPVTLVKPSSTECSGKRAQSLPLGMSSNVGEQQTLGVSSVSSLNPPVLNTCTVGEPSIPASHAAAASREASSVVEGDGVWGTREAPTEREDSSAHLGTVGNRTAAPVSEELMEWEEEETEVEWTKDMDKVCLEMCKKNGPGDDTFAQVAEKLKLVTPNEVAARFQKLMMLLSGLESEEDSELDD